MTPTLDQFQVATGSSAANAKTYYDAAVAAMDRYAIASPVQIAAFCASMGIETQRLTAMQENLNYTHPEHLASVFRRVFDEDHNGVISQWEVERCKAYCGNPTALSIKLYGGFHGRGGLMLTWQRNYAAHAFRNGKDWLNKPDLLLQPEDAMLSAASFWDAGNLNAVAANMGEVTLRVNGPARLALAERIALFNEGTKVMV